MTTATHTNKKTGMQVQAWVNSWKANDGDTSITYRKVVDGQTVGPLITTVGAKFSANYREA